MNIYDFTPEELEDVKWQLSDIYQLINREVDVNNKPIGILLGGQPASGKTKLFERIRSVYPEVDFVEINGDEYRQYHPRAAEINEEYGQDAPKYTQTFSNTLVEYIKAECLRLRCNFIIEGTMRTYTVIERTTREIKQAGFLM